MTWRIKNWEKYQHYKDRDPPWIKLHRDTLTSRMWVSLDNDGRALAVACMLIAAGTENQIPDDLGFIKRRGYFDKIPDLSPLVECGFIERCENNDVADASTDASKPEQVLPDDRPETETEKRQRREEAETDSCTRAFAEFCQIFPKQRFGNKAKAEAAFKRALKRDSAANILLGAREYADSDEVRDGFAKGAAAWLNDDRWKVDYRALRKRTADDMREEFLHGDQGDDLGSGAIDGECVEIPEPGPEGDGGDVAPGAEGSVGRGRKAWNGSAPVELEQGKMPDAGGSESNRRRVEALTAQAAQASTARAQPRGNHAQAQGGHLPRSGNPGVRPGGEAAETLDAGGTQDGGGQTERAPPSPRGAAPITPDELRDIPGFLDRRSEQ